MVTADGLMGPPILFCENRPPSVMVCFFAAASTSAAASASGFSGVTTCIGDKSLRYIMCLMEWNFEQEPHEATDETGVNLRAYFDRMPDDKMREYSPAWSDQQVTEWDGNFRDDGALFLVCSERDVEIGAYRRMPEECIQYRDRVRIGA